MHITVHIYSYLRYYIPAGEKSALQEKWEIPEGATIKQALAKLKLPKEVRITVLVNNNSVDQSTVLKEGDVIHVLPQMGGG